MSRYQAVTTINHDYLVVDITRLSPWNYPEQLADCPDLETAQKIALALNRTADSETDPEKRLLQLRAQRNAINLEIELHIDKWVKSLQNAGAA